MFVWRVSGGIRGQQKPVFRDKHFTSGGPGRHETAVIS